MQNQLQVGITTNVYVFDESTVLRKLQRCPQWRAGSQTSHTTMTVDKHSSSCRYHDSLRLQQASLIEQ